MRFKIKDENKPYVRFAWYPVRTKDTNELVWLEKVWKIKNIHRFYKGYKRKEVVEWSYYFCKENWEKENKKCMCKEDTQSPGSSASL